MRQETDKPIEKQIALWGLLGPSLIIATLLLGFLYPIKPLALSTASLLALFCAWRWKIKGLIPAIGFLALGVFWQLHEIAPRAYLFTGLFTLSLLLALIVTAFSYDQVAALLRELQKSGEEPQESGLPEPCLQKSCLQEPSFPLNVTLAMLEQQQEESQERYTDLQCELQETQSELEKLYLSKEIQHLQAQQQILQLQEQIQQLEEFSEERAALHEEVYQELQYLQAWQSQKELDEKIRQMEMEEEESLIKEAWLANVHELSELESIHAQDVDDLHGLIHNLITLQLTTAPVEELPQAQPLAPRTVETIVRSKTSVPVAPPQPAKSALKPTPKPQIQTTELKKPSKAKSHSSPPPAAKTKPQTPPPPAVKESSKAAGKQKKTNVWANAILSRWSPPEEKKDVK